MTEHTDQASAEEQDDMRFYIEVVDGVDTSGMSDEQVMDYIDKNASTGSMAYVPVDQR